MDMVLEQFKLNILVLLSEEKTLSAGMHLDVFQSIWLKFGKMIDANDFYIWMLV